MKNNASLVYNLFLVLGDFLALVAAFVGAYVLRVRLHVQLNPNHLGIVHAVTYIEVFLVLLPFWILIFALLGLYNSSIYESHFREAGRLLVGSFIGMLFVVFWNFAAAKPIFPARLIPIYGFAFGFIFLVIFRAIARLLRTAFFKHNIGLTNVLLIGSNSITDELVASLSNPKTGYKVLAVVGGGQAAAPRKSIPAFQTFKAFLESKEAEQIQYIIQTELYANEATNSEILTFAQEQHIAYRFTPGNSELFVGNIEVELFQSRIPVIAVRQTALFGWGRVVKRLADVILGALCLIIASPFLLVVAVAVKCSDIHAPILFRQTRLTRFNQKFTAYKFRTVKSVYNGLDPEEAFTKMGKPELIAQYRENADYIPNDPRFTAFSRFIRKTSLDELPQLFNLMRGDISLVGPRPLIPQELALYAKRHQILSVKSGMTGLAVVSRRPDMSFDERRKLDLYYVQNWSMWLDLMILARTVWVVLTGRGARQ
jgi:exopolysaccharide biosynthesis polyprenyl glycosylphosphotransferase